MQKNFLVSPRPIEYCADLRRIYVDPDMGDAGIEQNGGKTPRMRMVRGSSEAERFFPSSADAGGVICLRWRRLLRHRRLFSGGVMFDCRSKKGLVQST